MSGQRAVVLIGPAHVRHGLLVEPEAVHVAEWEPPDDCWADNTVILDHRQIPKLPMRMVPLYALVPGPAGLQPYTRTCYSARQSLMLALGGLALPEGGPSILRRWLGDLAERHTAVAPYATNHQRWFVNARPGLEVEHKFTLYEQPDIWTLARKALTRLIRGEILGWVPEYGNNDGFEEWDFLHYVALRAALDSVIMRLLVATAHW